MYWWAKDEFGRIPGFTAAVFYLFAPYHLIDVHFRGSVGEVFSFVFIPLIFLFARRLILTRGRKYFFLEALAVVCILMSHSSTTLVVIPLATGYVLIIWLQNKKRKLREFIFFIASIVYGLLLSAAYWLPALLEVKYTWWSAVSIGDFKPIWQYLYSPVAFGLLFQGHQGEYRLIIGYFQLIMVVIAIILMLQNNVPKGKKALLIYLLLSFFFLFFMMLTVSKPIWQSISLLNSFLMPWRLLVPLSFITASVAALVVMKISNKYLIIVLCFLTITSTVLNWANRKIVPPLNNPFVTADAIYTEYFDKNKSVYIKRMKQGEPNIFAKQPTTPLKIIKGKGTYVTLERTQILHEYALYAQIDSVIRENIYYFPGWTVFSK